MTRVEYTFRRSYNDSFSKMENILQQFTDIFQINLIINNPNGNKRNPERTRPNVLFINFFSSPSSTVVIQKDKKKIFGVELIDEQTRYFEPSPINNRITRIQDNYAKLSDDDDEEEEERDEEETVNDDNIVAEVINGSLYILFNITKSKDCEYLLHKVLEQYVIQHLISKANDSNKSRLYACLTKFNQEWYSVVFKKQLSNDSYSYQHRIRENQSEINSMSRKIEELSKENVILQKIIAFTGELIPKIESEYQKIISLPEVEFVDIVWKQERSIITVFTKMIEIHYEDDFYQIGKFKIDIYPYAYTNEEEYENPVVCHNLTCRSNGYDHPHVSNGECCFGDSCSSVPKLLGRYEIADLVKFMIYFLKSYNDSNPFHSIGNWPIRKR